MQILNSMQLTKKVHFIKPFVDHQDLMNPVLVCVCVF